MDTAGTGDRREAVTHQGVLIGQHSTALQEIMAKLLELSHNVVALGTRPDPPAPTAPPVPPPAAAAAVPASTGPWEPWV